MEKKAYVKPSVIRIERPPAAKKLYELEERRNRAIMAAAWEWSKLMSVPREEFWTRALPQQLFDLLDSFDHEASKVVAEAYLEFHKQRYGE